MLRQNVTEKLKPLKGPEIGALAASALQQHFHQLQPAWVERHLTLLCSLRKMFGNDLDKPIILAVIGQMMFAHSEPLGEGYIGALASTEDCKSTQLTNIESISLATGIPRESVRRKVGELIKIGWIKRDTKGRLLVTSKAANELDASSQAIFGLLADMFARIAKVLVTDQKVVLYGVEDSEK
jgi:hypothetical protein